LDDLEPVLAQQPGKGGGVDPPKTDASGHSTSLAVSEWSRRGHDRGEPGRRSGHIPRSIDGRKGKSEDRSSRPVGHRGRDAIRDDP
jgi:hypothetical protein